MGFYNKYIFPFLMDLALGRKKISEYRKATLSGVQGKILEMGFGTGLNLPHYPSTVQAITVIDPNPGMKRKALKRMARSEIQVDHHQLKGEKLPFENKTFDSVVTTFTLCSIEDLELALWEIHRVLKDQGKFFFLEHGLSMEEKVQKWQHRLTPVEKIIADGCHFNRDMTAIIESAGFQFSEIKKFYAPGFPKFAGFFYQGIAEKESR